MDDDKRPLIKKNYGGVAVGSGNNKGQGNYHEGGNEKKNEEEKKD